MQSHNRYRKDRSGSGGGKDSFWGLAVLAVLVVTTLSLGVSLYVDSQIGLLSGGIANESSALAMAQAAGLAETRH